MPFANGDEARRFLVEKISARALAEGCPLSDDERSRLLLPTSSSELVSGGEPFLDAEDLEESAHRMGALLRHAYELDSSSDTSQGRRYRDAVAVLARGDVDLKWIAAIAGLAPPMSLGCRAVVAVAGFVFLVLPALGAFLIATSVVWAARSRVSAAPGEALGMIVLALVFAGFGAYLLWLWLKGWRRPGRMAREGVEARET